MLSPDTEPGTVFQVHDASKRDIGIFRFEEFKFAHVCGTFQKGPDYATVEPLLRNLEEIIENQILSLLDDAWEAVNDLHLQLSDGTKLRDTQIYSDGGMSFLVDN